MFNKKQGSCLVELFKCHFHVYNMNIKKTIIIVVVLALVIWLVWIFLIFTGVTEPEIEYIPPDNAIETTLPSEIDTFYEFYNKKDYQSIQNMFGEEVYHGAILHIEAAEDFREHYGQITDYYLNSATSSTQNGIQYIVTVKYENIPEDMKTYDRFTIQDKKIVLYSSGAFNIQI